MSILSDYLDFYITDIKQTGVFLKENVPVPLLFYLCLILSLGFLIFIQLTVCFWFPVEVLYYHQIAYKSIVLGQIPYINFPLEHPPGVFVYFFLIYCLSRDLFVVAYIAVNWFMTLLTLIKHKLLALHQSYCLILLVLLSPYIFWRYDILPALLTYLSFKSLEKNRYVWSGFLLGLGIIIKIYPVFLIPLLLIFILTGGSTAVKVIKKSGLFLAGMIAGMAVPAAFLFYRGGFAVIEGIKNGIFSYHLARGIQIESLWGGLYLLINQSSSRKLIETSYGSYNAVGFSGIIIKIIPVLQLAVFFLIYLVFFVKLSRKKQDVKREAPVDDSKRILLLAAFCLLTLLVLISLNKVFSPQYLIWPLFFFLELIQHKQIGKALRLLYLVCAALTFFMVCFYGALTQGDWWMLIILNLRNGLMLASVWLLVRQLLVNKKPTS